MKYLPLFLSVSCAMGAQTPSFTPASKDGSNVNPGTWRTVLSLVPGTNVQAYNANLETWASVTAGTGVNAFLATPSSANFAAAVTGETGTGAVVFGTSPTLVTPALGTPSSGVATNLTGTAAGLTAGTVLTNASEAPTLYNNFEDVVLWPTGSTITNNVSQPTIGPSKFWFNTSGTPACNVANGGYGASATGGPWYLGSSVPTSGGGTSAAEMSLGIKFTEDLMGSGFNNTFNISFSQNVMMDPATGNISPDGVVHANFDLGGCAGVGYYTAVNRSLALTNASTTVTLTSGTTTGITVGMFVNHTSIPLGATVASITDSTHFELSSAATSTVTTSIGFSLDGTRFVCTNATFDGSKYPWSTLTGYQITHNRPYVILTRVVGDVLTYTIPGVGHLTFTEPHLHNKIGTTNTYWWFEDIRSGTYSSSGRINCVWGGPRTNLDKHPAFGAYVGGNTVSLNSNGPHIFPGTMVSDPSTPNGYSSTEGGLMIDLIPDVGYGLKLAAPTATSNLANGANAHIEGKYVSNVGRTDIGGSVEAYAPANVPSGITATISSAAGSETTIKQFVRLQSFANSDSQSFKIFGQLVGASAKKIKLDYATYGGTIFDSNATGTPLDAISGPYEIEITRFSISGAGSLTYAQMRYPDGTLSAIQRLSSNLTTEYAPINFKTTTVSAGGVTIDGALLPTDKVIPR